MQSTTATGSLTSRLRNSDAILGLSLAVTSLAFLGYTIPLSADAAAWPRGVLIVLLLLGSAIAVRGLRAPAPESTQESTGDPEWSTGVLRGPLLTMLIIVGYVALVSVVGFFPATALYLCAQLWFGGVRDLRVYAGLVVGFIGLVYLLFSYQLQVPLPTGILFG